MEAIARETDFYRSSFSAFEEERLGGQPLWAQELRREAFACFQQLGFPTTKTEAWKYTNVAPIARTTFRLAIDGPAPELPAPGPGGRFVFVNGRFRPELSRPAQGGAARVTSLREALAARPQAIEPHLARYADFRRHAFTAWNTAFFEDGAFVEVPPGAVVTEPIELLFLPALGVGPTVYHPRNLIVVGADSHATFVERYAGDGGTHLTNAVTELFVGEGAVVEHYKVQREGLSAYHVQTLEVRQARASTFTSHNVAVGAALARTGINVLFEGEGGECALNGLFVGAGTQHIDNHTLIDHGKPHCTSRELYKGIMDGKSRGVFHGTIIVRPDAQKTDAMQTNKNLLLSREALVDSTPALEIFADDVKCKHGSTIGQLDANALFYLRSRGLDEEQARKLLTYAFAADVAGRIRLAGIRREIEDLLGLRLAASGGSGGSPRPGSSTLSPEEVLS